MRLAVVVAAVALTAAMAACAEGLTAEGSPPNQQASAALLPTTPATREGVASVLVTETPAPTPQATQTPTYSPVPTPTATPSPAPSPTLTLSPTPTQTAAATPTPTPSRAPTATPGRTATGGAAGALAGLELERAATGLREAVFITHAGDGSRRLFVVERRGKIRVVAGGRAAEQDFLDISNLVTTSGSEQGLLGLVFHPSYRDNGRFFVNYTNRAGDTVIAEYRVDPADPNRALQEAVGLVLEVDQPFANHNGGMLAFGPDGYLYIGLGDGGSAGDPRGNGQNLRTLLGKMLRIDVDAATPYSIPPDNPFVGRPQARPEIWAYGLRNPWRYAFDIATGDLYIADVGQNQIEEVDFQAAASSGGENYGWDITEGSACYEPSSGCNKAGLVLPVAEYQHSHGCSITGGYVYRGRAQPALVGKYLYGDYCSGKIWTLERTVGGDWISTEWLSSGLSISSFGEGEDGEIYVADLAGNAIYRVLAITG